MKKLLYILAIALQAGALAGMYVVDYYAHAKLGMNRWLGYNNTKWEENLHPNEVSLVVLGLLAVLAVVAVVLYVRRERKRPLQGASLAATVVMAIAFGAFALAASTADFRAYYLMLALLAIAAVIQVARTITLLLVPDSAFEAQVKEEEQLTSEELKLRKTRRIARWATIIVLAALVFACLFIPSVKSEMTRIFALLSSGNIDAVAKHIASYGPAAAAVSFLLMILQSLAAPIPAFLITFANAAVFGWWQGAILSWTSAMAGAAVCFYIARVLGRDAVAHFVTTGALKTVDKFFERYGSNTILICRLLPFMSFDYVSYAAGLTNMKFRDFFIATGIGQLPATIVYSYVGGMLTGGAQIVMTALLIMFALAALVVLIRQVFTARHADLMDEESTDEHSEPADSRS